MRILLVQAWLGREQHPVLPLGLACIAASLDDHHVRILDLNTSLEPMATLEGALREFAPDVSGFSLRNCDTTGYSDPFSYIPAFTEQMALAEKVLPGTHVMAGGAGFSVFYREIMENFTGIHCGVTGHGEKLAGELVKNRARGLYHGKEGEFSVPRLDLIDTAPYLVFERNLSAGVEVNRGCDKNCRYCTYGAISGRQVMNRPVELITGDVCHLLEKGFRHIFMIAPLFNPTKQRGVEIARALSSLRKSFSWEAYHTARGFDDEYADTLARSGCTAVSFSPDGGTRRQMDIMGKDYSEDCLKSALKAAVSAGLDVSLNIFPWHEETGTAGMIKAFMNGVAWGRICGPKLRRLRFGLIRRVPDSVYEPASLCFSEGIPQGEFVTPSPGGMVVYSVLKRLFERSSIQ